MKKIYNTTAATVFTIVALLHLVRVIEGWEIMIDGTLIPIWVSWAVIVLLGYLAIRGFQLGCGHCSCSCCDCDCKQCSVDK